MERVVDVIIPTYKPNQEFLKLLDCLNKQTVIIHKIIVINTEEKYYERLLYGQKPNKKYDNIEVRHISQKEFDHGKTRNYGVKKSDAPYFVCMTQDAMPKDEHLIEALLEGLSENGCAIAYGRQLPNREANEIEKFTRTFNYPETPKVKSAEDIRSMGIKTFFCSNVCAAYDRKIFDSLEGFVNKTIFNEDMIYAASAIKAGYKIAYCPDAQVYHSHKYTAVQQFHRNFDLGVSQADHPEVFADISSESEGIRLVKLTAKHLKETGNNKLLFSLLINSAFKFLGYQLGKRYKKLPTGLVKKISSNKAYWRNV